jgi:diguanylate cyclase (GGDEF)-like protein
MPEAGLVQLTAPLSDDGMSDTRREANDSGPLMIQMLAQVVPEVQMVEIVMTPGQDVPGFPSKPWSVPGIDLACARIRARVVAGLLGHRSLHSFSSVIAGTPWKVLVELIGAEGGSVVGAVVVARQGRVWARWERSLVKAFGAVLTQGATLARRERSLLLERGLDGLVGQVAERLMSTSAQTREAILTWTMRTISESLRVDVAVLRRHDHAKELSVMEAQWPAPAIGADVVPTAVAFDADPARVATAAARGPFVLELGPQIDSRAYFVRGKHGRAEQSVAMMCLPLFGAGQPWGTLSLFHVGRRTWAPEELRMLQAVGALLMQMQARIEAEAQTLHNAVHDELTGLPNRRALLVQLIERLNKDQKTAILFFDLDRFKVMNDFLGHASGDTILSTVAGRIRATIGPDDFAARLGGDEFVVLFSGMHDDKEAIGFADRILGALRQPIELAGQQISHAASVGIVFSTPGVRNGMDLIGWADIALYAAKKRGGNQAVLFDEALKDSVGERSRTELTLRRAIERDGLRIHYQPEMDLRTGRLLAVEALVRWQHPEQGLLPASAFMSVAEETGLVVDMGRWVFTEVCRQLAVWRIEYPDVAIIVRVNVSPSQFLIGDLVKFVENCLESFRVPGERLCIEIAERAILQEPEQTALIVSGFRALGIEVAIDDFGTNYASFAALKRLPVNYLKLSPEFVQGMGNDTIDRAIVETIINLATALDLGVIAKGIESRETIEKLLAMTCGRGQGSFISLPMTAKDLGPLLRTGIVGFGSDRWQGDPLQNVLAM